MSLIDKLKKVFAEHQVEISAEPILETETVEVETKVETETEKIEEVVEMAEVVTEEVKVDPIAELEKTVAMLVEELAKMKASLGMVEQKSEEFSKQIEELASMPVGEKVETKKVELKKEYANDAVAYLMNKRKNK